MNKYISQLLVNRTYTELGELLGVHRTAIYHWLHGNQPIPAHVALKIHNLTEGKIKYYQLNKNLPKLKCL